MSRTVAVIGGGPAGMMAAGTAAENGCRVLLFEKNKILGKKLLITGKGRCNVTNFCDTQEIIENMTGSIPRFMYGALSAFTSYDTYAFFEQLGVPLKVERGNRVFPQSDRASDIRNALESYVRDAGVTVVCERVTSVKGDPVTVTTDKREYFADAVVIATGGLSYPQTGSTGDGYAFAGGLGHSIVPTAPSLVGLTGSADVCRRLAGLSLKNVSVKFTDETGALAYDDFGEMLFTHSGVSGPTVLSASARLNFKKHSYTMYIDLKPALDFQTLDARLLRDFSENLNKDFINSLDKLLPKKLIPVVVERCGTEPHKKVNNITKTERSALIKTIKAFSLPLDGKEGYDEAIVTSGGVDCSEIDPKTMGSLRVKWLYFAGEVMDVSANTGGFNLQIAFSSGRLAGLSCSGGKNEL